MVLSFFMILVHIGPQLTLKAVIAADDGRSIPIMTMGPICIAPELKRKVRMHLSFCAKN